MVSRPHEANHRSAGSWSFDIRDRHRARLDTTFDAHVFRIFEQHTKRRRVSRDDCIGLRCVFNGKTMANERLHIEPLVGHQFQHRLKIALLGPAHISQRVIAPPSPRTRGRSGRGHTSTTPEKSVPFRRNPRAITRVL